jgi:hypothetical protein
MHVRVEIKEQAGNEWVTKKILSCKASVEDVENALFAINRFNTQWVLRELGEIFKPIGGQDKSDVFAEETK